jgi:uncharacterized membrane protein
MEPIFLILLPLFLAGSIVAFMALAAARRIESTLKSFPLNELRFRVYQLEKKLAELQKNTTLVESYVEPPVESRVSPAPPPFPTPAVPEAPKAQESAPAGAPQPASTSASRKDFTLPPSLQQKPAHEPSPADLEALIGGRWFNRIGIIALLFAVSYFLKLAFDNNWIGPGGRVAIGIFLGVLMLPWSEWLLSRDYTYFSEGIAGLGEAILFVSVWAGCQYYALFSRETGFIALVLVTATMAFLALRRNSERIAFLSLLGGVFTPALMSSGKNEQFVLFSYLLCLGAAALAVSWRRNWQSLLPLVFVGTQLYFWDWYDTFYSRTGFLARTAFFATLFFLLYAVIPVLRAVRGLGLRALDLLLVFANALAISAALFTLLWQEDRGLLTLFFLTLAAGHLAITGILLNTDSPDSSLPRMLYTGLAVTFFTLAIPVRLKANNITLAFAVEGAALVWAGFRSLGSLLRPAGYFLLVLAAIRLFDQPPLAATFLWNERFATYLVLIACLAFALGAANAASSRVGDIERTEMGALAIAINIVALTALSLEFWDYFARGTSGLDNSLAQHLSISVLWTFYAGVLIFLGIQRHSPLLRWQAIILLGVVVVKVFFFDLSFLARVYRILSFFILGSALLAVSFLYQRKLARDRADS